MTSRDRVLTALKLMQPDRVPFIETKVDRELQIELMGKTEFTESEFADFLGLDAIRFNGFLPPIFANKQVIGGREMILDGLIQTREELHLLKLPDPNDPKMYKAAQRFLDENTSDHAVSASLRLGIAPMLLSMGIEGFSYALYEDRELISEILERYVQWTMNVLDHVQQMDFDFLWFSDDLAFGTGTFFSPEIFRELIIPIVKKLTDRIRLPWIFHSDGKIISVVDDIMQSLCPNALHPIDPSCMDLKEMKDKYGKQVCLVGNIDINYTLTMGTEEEVDREVFEKIKIASPGGGYIVSSANSLTSYCKPQNVLAMAKAIKKYGLYR